MMKRNIEAMKETKLQRLVISCGGTGGHFYPGLSIAREFQSKGGKVLLLLSGVNARQQKEIAEKQGIAAQALPFMPSPLRRPFGFLRGLFQGFSRARRMIREFDAQAVLGMGSFAMLPVVLAGKMNKLPVALHDGNARIGRANRWCSFFAGVLGAGFPPVNGKRCHCPVVETGMPVRPELRAAQGISRSEAIAGLNSLYNAALEEERITILIVGGSQGAAIFNQVLPQALPSLSRKIQVLHLCGKGKLAEPQTLYAGADFPVLLLESSDRMEYFLGAADLVFARSGGSTLAELALFGKGAVLIPFPYAAEGHQTDNAAYFAAHGAAELVRNDEFTVEKASQLLQAAVDSPEKLRVCGSNALALARGDAAEKMLELIDRMV